MKFLNYLNEAKKISQIRKEIEQWKKDLRKMSKIYKDFNWIQIKRHSMTDTEIQKAEKHNKKELKKYKEAANLYNTFRNNLEDWLYKDVMSVKDRKDMDHPMVKDFKEKSWQALHYIGTSTLFPDTYDYRKDDHVPAPWLLDDRKKKNHMQNYNRYFRAMWDAIEDYLNWKEEDEEEKYPSKEQINVDGVNITLDNYGREERHEKLINLFISGLQSAIKKIKNKGFGKALKNLSITLDFFETNASGSYSYPTDELKIYIGMFGAWGDDVIIHEIGHRYYHRFLPKRAQEYWESVIYKHVTTINKNDINLFIDTYYDKIKNWFENDEGRSYIRSSIEKDIEKSKFELRTKSVFNYIVDKLPVFTDDITSYRNKLESKFLNTTINLEKITDYANKNSWEAFAEAFMLYIGKGPKSLGPWTRDFFKRVSTYGDIIINETEKKELDNKNIFIYNKINKYLKEKSNEI